MSGAAGAIRPRGLASGWPLGVMVTVLGLTTWLALAPGTTFPLPALAALADACVPAVLQPYRADLPHLLGFAALVVLFVALLGRAGVAAGLVLGFATLLEAVQLFVPWREASWADLRVNLLAVVLGLVLVGLGVTLGRWAWGRLTARVRVARRGMATGVVMVLRQVAARGEMALGQMAARVRKATSGHEARARRRAAGEGVRVVAIKPGCARAAPRQRRPRLKPIIAEFERSFGWRGVRARINRASVAPAEVTLWVPGVPSPAMALLARAIEAEWAARGQLLRIRLVAAAVGMVRDDMITVIRGGQ